MTTPQYDLKTFEKRPRRPLKALHHFRELIKNKEDTTQVFYIIEALNGDAFQKGFVKFANSENGQKRLKDKRYLPDFLDNHDWLRTLPEGSFGRAYLDFMTHEGLTAQGLVEEYQTSGIRREFDHPEMNIYGDRLRDTHDMLHVLTGYGRDALGEASVLGYSHSQHGGLGVLFIAYGAAREIKKNAPKGSPVYKSINEGRRLGQAAKDLVYEDIMELLPRPLDEARKYLGIALPTHYHDVHAQMHARGIDPYGVVGAAA